MITVIVVFTILAIIAFMTVIRPAVALAAIMLMFILEQYAQSGSLVFIVRPWLLNVAVGLIALEGVIVQFFRSDLRANQYPKAGYVVIGLFAFCVMSIIWSVYPSAGKAMLWQQAPYLVIGIIAAPLLISKFEDMYIALKWAGLIGLGLMLLILLTRPFGMRGLEMAGAFYGRGGQETVESSSLELASSAARIAIIALFLPLFRAVPAGLLLRWGVVAVSVVLIYLSQTRGQLVFLLLVLFLLTAWIEGVRSTNVVILIFGGIAGFLALMYVGVDSIEGRWEPSRITDSFYEQRLYPISVLMSAWIDAGPIHWVLGLGNSASYKDSILGAYPHNVPFEILGEEGLIGFGIYLTLLAMVCRRTLSMIKQDRIYDPNAQSSRLVKVVIALAVFEFFVSLKQGALATNIPFFMYALLAARLSTIERRPQHQYPE